MMAAQQTAALRGFYSDFVKQANLTPEEAERLFAALSENAEIRMPMAETFWAKRFGMLVDQFGVPWMVNCEKKQG